MFLNRILRTRVSVTRRRRRRVKLVIPRRFVVFLTKFVWRPRFRRSCHPLIVLVAPILFVLSVTGLKWRFVGEIVLTFVKSPSFMIVGCLGGVVGIVPF